MRKQAGMMIVAVISAVLTGEAMLNMHQISQAALAIIRPSDASGAPQTGQVTPPDAPVVAAGGAYIAKASDGHFWAWAQIEGRPVRVLIDTGATAVALTPDDARRIGVDLSLLVYDRPVSTAQGQIQAASVMLKDVSVAGAKVATVEALVVPKGLSTSLLGMSYLGRLDSFQATRNAMILRQ